eukprot:TRINITY_DN38784_c0_g1_i4.p1 TRINITY_DN38784_c0_g1~~TRINITY_DN38784_c0_g1_i4.p1  ORF type:complete len:235 (+),score=39.48 TRINITY_DN38784_c0_g1_i4:66-770(+)
MPFTGIIEEMGTVRSVQESAELTLWDGSKGHGFVIVVDAEVALGDCYEGASIATNGVCLTVTHYDDRCFTVNCANETLSRTNLGLVKPGDRLNLERAARSDARSSGHYVQGHVDGTGEVLSFTKDGDSLWVKIRAPKGILDYVVPKGYIAIDGTSLTVCDVNRQEGWFNLMLIAHTQKCIVLPTRPVGGKVNLEADVIGKYAAHATEHLQAEIASLKDEVKALSSVVATLRSKL